MWKFMWINALRAVSKSRKGRAGIECSQPTTAPGASRLRAWVLQKNGPERTVDFLDGKVAKILAWIVIPAAVWFILIHAVLHILGR
jgi:hypothetical protein